MPSPLAMVKSVERRGEEPLNTVVTMPSKRPSTQNDERVESILDWLAHNCGTRLHHSSKLNSKGRGERLPSLNCCSRRNQNCQVKTRKRRWLIVSSSWSQRGKRSGRGRFHRANLSTSSSSVPLVWIVGFSLYTLGPWVIFV
jgi:hypothetical protein